MREDVYGVFVCVQDEQQALATDYSKFASRIHVCLKEQLSTRDLIDKHLAEKARKAAATDPVQGNGRQFTAAR